MARSQMKILDEEADYRRIKYLVKFIKKTQDWSEQIQIFRRARVEQWTIDIRVSAIHMNYSHAGLIEILYLDTDAYKTAYL